MNNRDEMQDWERISALADGELSGEDIEQALRTLECDAQALEAWHAYHLIGDVMRHADAPASPGALAFAQRLSARLHLERHRSESAPSALPVVTAGEPAPPARQWPDSPRLAVREAANDAAADAAWRWKWLAAVASVVAVAAVAWTALSSSSSGEGASLAGPAPSASDLAVAAGASQGPMLRDPRLDELLVAHRQMVSATALAAPAAILQNAAYDSPGR